MKIRISILFLLILCNFFFINHKLTIFATEEESFDCNSIIATGSNYTLALEDNGSVWVWGDNSSGQLGDGTSVFKNVPTKLESISDVVSIVTGGSHSVALKKDGSVWAWGNNKYGQLGDGSTIDHSTIINSIPLIRNLSDSLIIPGNHFDLLYLHLASLFLNPNAYCTFPRS
jgi:alpha-tubulin suppressor-like RCC1 family protein